MNCIGTLPLLAVTESGLQFLRITRPSDAMVLLAIFLFMAFLFYIFQRVLAGELSPVKRGLLLVLRLTSLAALLLLVAGPVQMHLVNKSKIAVLLDTSLSMTLPDSPPNTEGTLPVSRYESACDFLQNDPLLNELAKVHQITFKTFNSDVQTLGQTMAAGDPVTSLYPLMITQKPSGEETRIASTLAAVEATEENLAGIILVSDGVSRSAETTSFASLGQPAVPVLCLAAGPRPEQMPPSLELSQVTLPRWIPQNDELTLTVQIRRTGQEAPNKNITSNTTENVPVPTIRIWQIDAQNYSEKFVSWQTLVEGKKPIIEQSAELNAEQDTESEPASNANYRAIVPLSSKTAGSFALVIAAEMPGLLPNAVIRPLDILDRRERILILADGPSRDFQFLQSAQRYRSVLDLDFVFLNEEGTNPPSNSLRGIELPNAEQLATYDVLVAFDPDWRRLPAEWLLLLEEWVNQGGGFIPVAGPLETGAKRGWLDDPALDLIRGLYPVQFGESSNYPDGRFTRLNHRVRLEPASTLREELPPCFSPAEKKAVGPSFWSRFDGVYSYLTVEKVKPGATLLARWNDSEHSNPDSAVAFARQRYGRGFVFYIGTPELWRMREVDETVFYRFYLDLFRQVMAGRILSDDDVDPSATTAGEFDDLVQNTNYLTQLAQTTGGVYLPLNSRERCAAVRDQCLAALPVHAQEVDCDRARQRTLLFLFLLVITVPLLTEWLLRRLWQFP